MKTLILAISAMILPMIVAGCSTQPKTIVSQDMDQAVVGARPEGYPKTVMKALPDRPGFCVAVTEDWKASVQEGQEVWLREKTIESVGCTKTRWERLNMGNY